MAQQVLRRKLLVLYLQPHLGPVPSCPSPGPTLRWWGQRDWGMRLRWPSWMLIIWARGWKDIIRLSLLMNMVSALLNCYSQIGKLGQTVLCRSVWTKRRHLIWYYTIWALKRETWGVVLDCIDSWSLHSYLLCFIRTTKRQTSLRIRAVWSAFLLFAHWIV